MKSRVKRSIMVELEYYDENMIKKKSEFSGFLAKVV